MAHLHLLHVSPAPSSRPSAGGDRSTATLQVQFKPRELRSNCDYGIHGVLYPVTRSLQQSSCCCVVRVQLNPQQCRYGWGHWFPCGWVCPQGKTVTQVNLPPAVCFTAHAMTIPAQLVLMASRTSPVFSELEAIAS